MRYLAARLAMTILFVLGTIQNIAVLALPTRSSPDANEMCSCAMCRTGEPGHHCSCCIKSKTCTCKMSSGNPDQSWPQAAKPGLLHILGSCRMAPKSEPVLLSAVLLVNTTYLPVLTPPPKACF
jgi:hypothetical protein